MRVGAGSSAFLAALGFAACTTEPGCDVCTTSAIVYGRVTTATGTPVAGARVRVEAFRNTCEGFASGLTNVEPVTAVDGSYRDQSLSPAAPFRACLRVTAMPPAGSGLSAQTVEGAEVQFLDDYRGRERDSVRVDVTLSP
jgi:hypothetical protein